MNENTVEKLLNIEEAAKSAVSHHVTLRHDTKEKVIAEVAKVQEQFLKEKNEEKIYLTRRVIAAVGQIDEHLETTPDDTVICEALGFKALSSLYDKLVLIATIWDEITPILYKFSMRDFYKVDVLTQKLSERLKTIRGTLATLPAPIPMEIVTLNKLVTTNAQSVINTATKIPTLSKYFAGAGEQLRLIKNTLEESTQRPDAPSRTAEYMQELHIKNLLEKSVKALNSTWERKIVQPTTENKLKNACDAEINVLTRIIGEDHQLAMVAKDLIEGFEKAPNIGVFSVGKLAKQIPACIENWRKDARGNGAINPWYKMGKTPRVDSVQTAIGYVSLMFKETTGCDITTFGKTAATGYNLDLKTQKIAHLLGSSLPLHREILTMFTDEERVHQTISRLEKTLKRSSPNQHIVTFVILLKRFVELQSRKEEKIKTIIQILEQIKAQ